MQNVTQQTTQGQNNKQYQQQQEYQLQVNNLTTSRHPCFLVFVPAGMDIQVTSFSAPEKHAITNMWIADTQMYQC